MFGSCKDITIGPTAIMALMIHSAVVNLNVDFAILGTFLSGCVVFMLGFLNLGFLVQFISAPTIAAFISAATIIIGSGQVKPLLGIKSGSSSEFIDSWINVFKHLDEIRMSDAALGLFSLGVLLAMKNLGRIKIWPKFFKYLSISRNAIVVIMGIAVAYIFYVNGSEPFRLTGDIKQGFPPFGPPPFSTEFNGKHYNFREMFNALGLSLITMPLVSILESVAIAKAFSKGKVIDATQEMIALGLCNVAASFASSIPITGSFTRTAINNSSGVKTQFGGCFTGALVLLALGFLTGTFYFIPKTVLAAVIIAAMISMIEIHDIIEIYRTKRSDSIPFVATFLFSLLFGLEYGILVGIGINILFTLYATSRPKIDFDAEKINEQEVLIVAPDQSLIYSAAEHFKSAIIKKSTEEYPNASFIIINGASISFIDSTVAKVSSRIIFFLSKCEAINNFLSQILASLVADLAVNNKKIYFWNWQREAFHVVMRYNRQYFELFKHSDNLTDLMIQIKQSEALSEIKTNE